MKYTSLKDKYAINCLNFAYNIQESHYCVSILNSKSVSLAGMGVLLGCILSGGSKGPNQPSVRLYKDYLQEKDTSLKEVYFNYYKKYKNKLTSLLRVAKKRHYNLLLERNKHDLRRSWRIINEIISHKKVSNKIPNEFFSEGTKYSNDIDIANGFNTHYTNITRLHDSENQTQNHPIHYSTYLPQSNPQSIFFTTATEKEIEDNWSF